MTRTTFQTRARTIDHLGRGQIADCPTAVSELWKNAYDADAAKVSLHVFDGATPAGAIFDDGVGMSREDFLERWLVIGTESKVDQGFGADLAADEDGRRPRQGEKGIGRLSAAFLAPTTLIVSKRADAEFVAALVDWRLFENPYLSLDDIAIAVESFADKDELFRKLPEMFATVRASVEPPEDDIRRDRLLDAWMRFERLEQMSGTFPTTAQRILASPRDVPTSRHLSEWPVFGGGSPSGTAILLLDVHRELALHVQTSAGDEDDEVRDVKDDLIKTLTGFTDPYAEIRDPFAYEVVVHIGNRRSRIVSDADVFSLSEFRSLEHSVDGAFDENGVFRGTLRVFGIDRGVITHVPRRPPPRSGRDRLGPFAFSIGSFEQELENTTHPQAVHAALKEKTERYGGVYLYRDQLRVMPYGNPDSDLFGIEERRSRHAGRNFWVHRRSFGRTAFSRMHNPNLRDKAGREGLVDNRAFRELRILVVDLLTVVARRYFGTDSDIRKEELSAIQERNKAAHQAATKARKNRTAAFRKFLRSSSGTMEEALREAAAMRAELGDAVASSDAEGVAALPERLDALRERRERLRLPQAPARLGDDEAAYRRFRDDFKTLTAAVDAIGQEVSSAVEDFRIEAPEETAARRLSSIQSRLNAKLERYRRIIDGQLTDLRDRWKRQVETDFKSYYLRASPIPLDLERGVRLSQVLNGLDAVAVDLEEQFAARYEPFLRTLEQLRNDVDLEGALAVTEQERADLDRRVNDFNILAQMGIAVEIIGHELDAMDAEVRRNLARLPDDVRRSDAFRLAYEAHRAMSDRLRFLAPLRVAGYRSRESISGDMIADFVMDFFGKRIRDERVDFEATPMFRSLHIDDLRSRILPVFINLVNNALYWIRFSEERRIRLDLVGNLAIVADSGPGVDEQDVPHLFDLFFTRRTNGRGVGLHLCMLNLAASHHTIRYAGRDDPHVLPGANFIIEFRGLTHA